MKCSFIVSAFNRPDHLACCLASLRIQTERDFEVIVTDNGRDSEVCFVQRRAVVCGTDERFHHKATGAFHGARDCYESANFGAADATGEYICFPSDDGYYAPRFLELMLRHGAGADLIYCNFVWDGFGAECTLVDAAHVTGRIDKGGFLIKRSVFPGFKGPFGGSRCEDGRMIEEVVRSGATVKKVEIVGWMHN